MRCSAVEKLLERRDEVVEARLEHLLARVVEARHHGVRPRPLRGADLRLLVQDARGFLVALELEQPAHELLARVHVLLVALGLGGLDRHQHLRLDVDEGRRHHHELAGHVEAELLHHVQVLHVLARDGCDGDVVDVDLLALDEVEQEVERTLEEGQQDPRRVLGQDGLDALRDGDKLRGRRLPGGARPFRRHRVVGRVQRLVVLVVHGRE
jgi:hypothetical protein